MSRNTFRHENLARNDDIGSLEPVSLRLCPAENGDFGSRPTKPDHRVKTLREKGEDQGTGSIPLDVFLQVLGRLEIPSHHRQT